MENLNSIPKSGSYGTGVDLHNDNYQKIGVELQTLRELGQNNKGYFETLSALQTKYPTPQSGWQAYVKDAGSSTGYYVANVNSSGNWVVTAAEAPPINVDLAGYAKTGGSTKTVKQVEDEIVQLAGDVNLKAAHGYSELETVKTLKEVDDDLVDLKYEIEEDKFKIENKVANGNFANGTTGWETPIWGATVSAENNTLSVTGTGLATNAPRIEPAFNISLKQGDVINFRAKVKVTNSDCTVIEVALRQEGNISYLGRVPILNPIENNIYEINEIVTVTNTALYKGYFAHHYPTIEETLGKTLEIQEVMVVNLTETFGESIPNNSEVNEIINGWFDGVKLIPEKEIAKMVFDLKYQSKDYAKSDALNEVLGLALAMDSDKPFIQEEKEYDDSTSEDLIKGWVLAETFQYENVVYDNDSNIESAKITWPDGDVGSISNVVIDSNGITSIRYNRSVGYATLSITYNPNGEINKTEVELIKI